MRNTVVALGLLVVLITMLAALWLYTGGLAGSRGLSIEQVRGEVALDRDGERGEAVTGMRLSPGDRVRTGDDGTAVLSRGGRSPIQLAENTTVQLLSIEDDVLELALDDGRLKAQVRPDAGAVRLSAGDRTLVATDGDFDIARDGARLQVDVSRGDVSMSGVPGVSVVEAGDRLNVLPDGASALRPVPDELLLDVDWPETGKAELVTVVGRTEPGALVTVQGQAPSEPVFANHAGHFEASVRLAEGENLVQVTVQDAFGEARTVDARVVRTAGAPRIQIDLDPGR